MGDSYRIKTEIGINKTINVELEQNFNNIEILSLKIQQEDLYDQSCANYGVVIGRVTANNGFGIPNAKVSIFIPITDEDLSRPEIVAIYPYRTPEQKNEDGYRYNLLPYEPSYTGHVPTGTFPSRKDALIDKTAVEIYDKYYKYTVKTNNSGDYMIMGVPLGVQIVFMDLDLSDMGEFSLSPQDLIRMGRATEAQVSGRFFKSSNNLNSLPQIISLTKSIDVSPLWGDPGTCQVAINRVDFDLRDDANIDIQPTSVFMGSLISSPESEKIKRRCKPTKKLGELCSLVAGPGQIISIRQTVDNDVNGRPILEKFDFDGGNDVIDENGAWLVDLPMNMDYVTINEFGERVISRDPKVGIPTKAKYRFKIKWKQPDDLSQSIKRAYYLAPNIREYGWTSSSNDPINQPAGTVSPQYLDFVNSYAFSLDWADYGSTGTTIGKQMIQSAIDCEDKFYEFKYNQVYTIAGLIDLYHRGANKDRYIGIKNITNESCESTNYKFPTNDSVKGRDLLYTLINALMTIIFFIVAALIPVLHILAALWPIIKILFFVVFVVIFRIIYVLCKVVKLIKPRTRCKKPEPVSETWARLKNPFINIPLPMMTYPECELCECSQDVVDGATAESSSSDEVKKNNPVSCLIDTTFDAAFANINQEQYCEDDQFIKDFNSTTNLCNVIVNTEYVDSMQQLLSGVDSNTYSERTPHWILGEDQPPLASQDLTLSERLNLFNLKGKYFDSLQSQGGGQNQIKVRINPDEPANNGKFHNDNVLALLVDSSCNTIFAPGSLITFNDPEDTSDINILSGKTLSFLDADGNSVIRNSVTGLTTNGTSISLQYANPNNPNQSIGVQYVVPRTSVPDFATKNITQTTLGVGDNETVYYDFFLDEKILAGSMTINCGPVTFTDFGNGILSGANTSNTGTIDYESGSIVLQFANPPANGQIISASYTFFTQPGLGDQDYLVQKFPTDIEYFQVITATTYGQFISNNPQIPTPISGQQFLYNGTTQQAQSYFNSFKYRYTDNFFTIFRATDAMAVIGFGGVIYNKYRTYNSFRPIYAIPEQKEYIVVFLMRGVDPHSPRTDTEVDLSRLFGKQYGNVKVRGDFKLNVPIQPGLSLPRHDQILNSNSQNQGGYLFYPSYSYQPTNAFSAFSSNQIANYSSLDRDSVANFKVDDSNSFTLLSADRVSPNTSFLGAGGNNGFSSSFYVYSTFDSPVISTFGNPVPDWNPGAYTDNPITFDLSLTNVGKQHRSYYDNEYIEGGSYFYFNYNRTLRKPILNDAYVYFSPVYSTATTIGFTSGTQRVVMRSDRLPTSAIRTEGYKNNTYVFQQNGAFASFSIDDNGTVGESLAQNNIGYISGDGAEDDSSSFETQVINTFNCSGLVPLGCYEGSGEDLRVKPKSDPCYNKVKIQNGCFLLITSPVIINIPKDFNTLAEYRGRFRINFGACRGLFSHSFYNNWVNGVLFAFPFKNNRFFSSPTSSTPNQPYNVFCKDNIMLHPTTNNFYYRSSPYNAGSNRFIGKTGPSNGRNNLNLQFPTTITNLGPRDAFAAEVTLSPDYFGYNMDKYQQTSYQEVENLLNLFIISRLASGSGPRGFFGGSFGAIGKFTINQFFNSRRKFRVDGDYAQSISINSELGIEGFDFETYEFTSGSTGGNTFYLRNKTMGVFFSSDTQTRDYLSPRRIIRNDFTNPGLYDNLGFDSQNVPFYRWEIKQNSYSIFGDEKNEWSTSSSDIMVYPYQSLDRLNITTSDFYVGETPTIPAYRKGYIYNVFIDPTTGQINFEGDIRTTPPQPQILFNTGKIHVGSPFHFYFGLYRGKNALDLFNKKFLGNEEL